MLHLAQNVEFAPGLTVSTARTDAEIARFEPMLRDAVPHPNADPAFCRMISHTRSNVLSNYVVIAHSDNVARAALIGRISRQPIRGKFGYQEIALGEATVLDILHGGVVGECDVGLGAEFLDAVYSVLADGESDIVCFNHMDTGSVLFDLIQRRGHWWQRDHYTAPTTHWRASLPPSSVEFMQRISSKHRYWIRRIQSHLYKRFPGQTRWGRFAEPTDLHVALPHLEFVAGKTYQRQLGAGFVSDVETIAKMKFEAEAGWLRAYILYISDIPRAFWIGRVHKGCFHSDATGYDPEFREYELGTIVLMHIVEELCREGIRLLDFGLGDAPYKSRFGSECWTEATVRIFSPSLAGIRLNLLKTALDGSSALALKLASRLGFAQRLKTSWRKRLSYGDRSGVINNLE